MQILQVIQIIIYRRMSRASDFKSATLDRLEFDGSFDNDSFASFETASLVTGSFAGVTLVVGSLELGTFLVLIGVADLGAGEFLSGNLARRQQYVTTCKLCTTHY